MTDSRREESSTTDSNSTSSNPKTDQPLDSEDAQLAKKLQKEEEETGTYGERHPDAPPLGEKPGIPGPPQEPVETETHDVNGDLIPIEDRKSGRPDGKIELREEDAWEDLGFSFPTWKKWTILSVIFVVQLSLNFNTSVYPNAVTKISEQYNVSEQAARVGQLTYLIAYAFGSELWAPWSEELGRWPTLQASQLLVNIWQIPCALAPNYATIVVARFLGGLSSAGGSVTLGMVADMWEPDDQQFPLAFVVLSSVGGTTIGPIIGAFIQRYLALEWIFWIQLIFGGAVQIAHLLLVPETRSTIRLDRAAKRRRAAGETDVYGPNELKENRFSAKEIGETWARPFLMFFKEPIVLFLSLLSGFSDALIFTFLEAFQPVFSQWGFGTIALGLAYIPIVIGYLLAYASYVYPILKHKKIRARDPKALSPESRLWWLLFLAPLEPLGLFGFAWTSLGPPQVSHWIAPMIFSSCVAIANFGIYFSTVDYMMASYGEYAASATGGNALARDFLAGIAAMYSAPLYENLGPQSLEWASTLLAFLAILVIIPAFIFYYKGPAIRARSPFAQTLSHERNERDGRRATYAAEKERAAGQGEKAA